MLAGGLGAIYAFQHELRIYVTALQHEKAVSAAQSIETFIDNIERQLQWLSLIQADREFDVLYIDSERLLRYVPAISDVQVIDASGHERLFASRFDPDRVDSGIDCSDTPEFRSANAGSLYFSDISFRKGTEPYMKIAAPGSTGEIITADVNLTAIWDTIAAIKVGKSGYAYVVDAAGLLIAHPDLSLVLRRTSLTRLPQVTRVLSAQSSQGSSAYDGLEGINASGTPVVSVAIRIAAPPWFVFIEQPDKEASAPIRAAVLGTVGLMGVALVMALVTGLFLTRRLMRPIEALHEGAARIGRGDLKHRISITTGDELQALGDQFNAMATQLQQSYETLERKVEERTYQLQQANLAKSRFLAAASHDLRQPLHALGLFAAQLRTEKDMAERARIEERIESAVGAMNELFTALLDISKLDARTLSPAIADFPVARILGRIESAFAGPAREKGVFLRVVASRAWVRSDPIFLERIALNLVSNAVRYTARGGIVVGCRRRQSNLRLEVWDTGDGIPDAQIREIFEEFVQLERHRSRGAGLGLGLAIVQRLCGLMRHRLDVKSRVGKGSCFAVEVPLAEAHPESPDGPPADTPLDCSLREKLVVIVDDDPLVVDGMGGLLRSWGYGAVAANSAEAALSALPARRGPPDLIICDYHLAQGKSGIEAIRKIRDALCAEIPAFLVSGDVSPDRLRDAQDAGYTLLHKPVRPMALRAIVTRFLRNA